MTISHIVLFPRWAGEPHSDWYPWLAQQLPTHISLHTLAHAHPQAPTIASSIDSALPLLTTLPLPHTLLIGHSVGAQALLHALAAHHPDTPAAAFLAVAGWWTVDAPWETILPWIEQTPDLTRLRAACLRFVLALSDNDPFTADHAANATLWRQRLHAEVHLIPNAKHFNATQAPHIWRLIQELIDA